MSKEKKLIRGKFREACLQRDNYKCRKCGIKPNEELLDAHHITDRHLMPNGGYVKENGISLCPECHIKAEIFHSTGIPYEGYSPEDLYNLIGSSKELALEKSNELQVNRNNKI